MSSPYDSRTALGTPATYGKNSWVQTERKALEAWAHLTMTSPRASALLQHLVARMGHQNAVVVAQKTLAKMMGCNTRTVQRAMDDLVKGRWIQVVQIGTAGSVNAYVINSEVAWGEARDQIGRLSVFTATVIADAEDQAPDVLEHKQLRSLPIVYPPEEALPYGDGEPGAQIALPGFEPVIEGK
ncbi:MAG: helix-turn-helix domain-containing protein [Alphaproteobacteria bacterium]|nr:helix-turn-helix domain-containing protein [Alphaproteobacteria bacterium]